MRIAWLRLLSWSTYLWLLRTDLVSTRQKEGSKHAIDSRCFSRQEQFRFDWLRLIVKNKMIFIWNVSTIRLANRSHITHYLEIFKKLDSRDSRQIEVAFLLLSTVNIDFYFIFELWLTRILTCSHKHSEILFSEKLWRQWVLLHHIRTNLSFMHETVWSVFLREMFWIVTKCYYFWHDAEHCVMIIAAVTGTQQQINLESQWTPPAGATAFKQW